MPSYLHEWILELFRHRSAAAADLLRQLDVTVPEYDEVRVESPNVNDLQPVEYRADLVLFLSRGSQYVLDFLRTHLKRASQALEDSSPWG